MQRITRENNLNISPPQRWLEPRMVVEMLSGGRDGVGVSLPRERDARRKLRAAIRMALSRKGIPITCKTLKEGDTWILKIKKL